MKIPFWIQAIGKNYSGKEYNIEKIKYYYTGEKRDILILKETYAPDTFDYEIENQNIIQKYHPEDDYIFEYKIKDIERRYNRISEKEFKKHSLKYLNKTNVINDYEYEVGLAECISNEKERNLKLNEIEFLHGLKSEYDYEKEKVNITFPNQNSKEYKFAILSIERKYNKIQDYEYEIEFANLTYDDYTSEEYKLKIIEIELNYNKISEHQYEKKKCTIKNEPYFNVISDKFNEGKIEFELDWNDVFIKKLKEEGMSGHTEQQMVDLYFKEICKQVAEEEEIFDYTEQFGPSIEKDGSEDGTFYS